MPNSIFTPAWESLSSTEKQKLLLDSLLGLESVVVYLDDEEDALTIFKNQCAQLGLNSFCTTSPHEALDFVKKNKSKILFVVSDFQLPEKDGFTFRQEVMAVDSEVPFIILSGFVDREMALKGMEYKIARFVEKPLKGEKLLNIVKTDADSRADTIKGEYEMLKSFLEDVSNMIEEVEGNCLYLEENPNDMETVSRIFGYIHTIKGSSGFFDPKTLHNFAHAFEDSLKKIQSGSERLTSEFVSAWLKGCDTIKLLANEFTVGSFEDRNLDELKSIFNFSQKIEEVKAKESKSSDADKGNKEKKATDIKVSMQMIDEFTRASGELTVIRNMINKVVSSIEKEHKGIRDVVVLGELLEEMHKVNSDVQNRISDLRMVNIEQLTKPLKRNVRDTCNALNKKINFVIEGEDLRIDNVIADILSRSLIHIMRNSLDHGIELPEERAKKNKPEEGKLLLRFEIKGESVFVTIQDDGKGIDIEKIRGKVVSQGMRTEAEAKLMSAEELQHMIFESGFSTAAQVTEFSGRGVGMSMVKDSVESLGGHIHISSKMGEGSQFILEIPIPKSVLIMSTLFVTAGKMTFGLPQEHILKVLDLEGTNAPNLELIDGKKFLRYEENIVPVISFSKEVLNSEQDDEIERYLIIIDVHGKKLALKASSIFDIEDVVVKPFSLNSLKKLFLYKGGTFLGDGTVGLILDVLGLSSHLGIKIDRNKKRAQILEEASEKTKNKESVIIFELNQKGRFAILEKDIFRIESLASQEFQQSGNNMIVPYRESMLNVVQVENFIFKNTPKDIDLPQEATMIALQHKESYLGIVVKNIIDLDSIELNLIQNPIKKQGTLGEFLYKDHAVTLLDVNELKEFIISSTSMKLDEAA